MRQYHIHEYRPNSVILQDIDTLALIELPYSVVDQMKHLIYWRTNMNIELIKKYKKEFNLFLENESNVLMKIPNDSRGWIKADWNFPTETLVTIDDKYAIFRKASAEGKTVQMCSGGQNYTNITVEDYLLKEYDKKGYPLRIKPEEPQFKVGDFVRNTSSNTVFKYEESMLKPDSFCCIEWIPQAGELCWFADNTPDQYAVLDTFRYLAHSGRFHSNLIDWKYCEPFLNSKPSWFKD